MDLTSPHVVLLGDSIFDNQAYTGGEPDVVTHLRRLLPAPWRATLLAEDGAMVAQVGAQLRRVPADTSHLVISMGGNDALSHADLLSLRVTSSAEALSAFARRLEHFETAYRAVLARAIGLGPRTIVCTVYNGALDASEAPAARMGLTLFNDVILRAAAEARVDAIELRSICVEAADYANPIEPSGRGGLKIASAVARAVGAVDDGRRPSRVWAGGEPLMPHA